MNNAFCAPEATFSAQDYWDFENGSELKHEFFEGRVYAREIPDERHHELVGNILASLHQQLRGKPCRVRSSDQRLEIEETGLQTYPDVMVACPPFRYNERQTINILDATVIVEVLSDKTRSYDRTGKFEHYKRLPTLRHYVLVEQNSIEIEHHVLINGQWNSKVFNSLKKSVGLAAIACELQLDDVYEGIDLGKT